MIESAETLIRCARELDDLSRSLLTIEKELAALEVRMTVWEEDTHAAMWQKHMEDGDKLPPETIRIALAHQSFPAVDRQRLLTLKAARGRAKARISDLREIVAAHRSIVSAEKAELEASEGPQPAWTPAG
jgi:hypothetical protein